MKLKTISRLDLLLKRRQDLIDAFDACDSQFALDSYMSEYESNERIERMNAYDERIDELTFLIKLERSKGGI